MDDGHLKQNNNKPHKIILSTESFTKVENEWLIHFLNKKFSLKFSYENQNRIILYDQFQIYYFLYLITPYLHESMYRKIIKSYNFSYKLPPKRTTIYLPSNIELISPTKDINTALKELDKIIIHFKKGLFYKKYLHAILQPKTERKSYQINLDEISLEYLYFLNGVTGINFSHLTSLCFYRH